MSETYKQKLEQLLRKSNVDGNDVTFLRRLKEECSDEEWLDLLALHHDFDLEEVRQSEQDNVWLDNQMSMLNNRIQAYQRERWLNRLGSWVDRKVATFLFWIAGDSESLERHGLMKRPVRLFSFTSALATAGMFAFVALVIASIIHFGFPGDGAVSRTISFQEESFESEEPLYEIMQGANHIVVLADSSIRTHEDKSGTILVGKHTIADIAGSSNIQITSSRELTLNKGAVWLDVQKGGEGFEVTTELAKIIVTGTSFGVRQADLKTIVEVGEGSVQIQDLNGVIKIQAGEQAVVTPSGIQKLTLPVPKDFRPQWSAEMHQVIPYEADESTALLFHMDEPFETVSSGSPYSYDITDASLNSFHTRTHALGNKFESPFQGIKGPDGLGGAASLSTNPKRRIFRHAKDEGVWFYDSKFNTESFTIEAWIKNDSGQFDGDFPGVFRIQDNDDLVMGSRSRINFGLTTAENGEHELRMAIKYRDDFDSVYTNGTPLKLNAGEWYHVAVTYQKTADPDRAIIEFFCDSENNRGAASRFATSLGQIDNAVDVRAFNHGSDGFFEVGAFVGKFSLNGSIDEFRWSNTVRSEFNLSK